MRKDPHPGLLLNKKKAFTLIEMLVTLGIMSILAGIAIPYGQMAVKRGKEAELRSSLREIRSAIDRFHDDWTAGKMSKLSDIDSEDGYPKNLETLLQCEAGSGPVKKYIKYLRAIPRDPFSDQSIDPADQWGLRSFPDYPDSSNWGGEDVYDVYSMSEKTALDGSKYADW